MVTTDQSFQFCLSIGDTPGEALQVLETIKRSASDVLYQANAVDCSANDETVDIMKEVYSQAKAQIRLLRKHL